MLRNQLILAIQNLDIQQINFLLSDTKTYMNVSKILFLKKLHKKFEILENQNFYS